MAGFVIFFSFWLTDCLDFIVIFIIINSVFPVNKLLVDVFVSELFW